MGLKLISASRWIAIDDVAQYGVPSTANELGRQSPLPDLLWDPEVNTQLVGVAEDLSCALLRIRLWRFQAPDCGNFS